jgi:hypothetical protein
VVLVVEDMVLRWLEEQLFLQVQWAEWLVLGGGEETGYGQARERMSQDSGDEKHVLLCLPVSSMFASTTLLACKKVSY